MRTFNRQPKTGSGTSFRAEAGGGSSGNGGHRRWVVAARGVACLRGAALKSTAAGAA
jgi:hypothetical protein